MTVQIAPRIDQLFARLDMDADGRFSSIELATPAGELTATATKEADAQPAHAAAKRFVATTR
jgi:hypothetical protein